MRRDYTLVATMLAYRTTKIQTVSVWMSRIVYMYTKCFLHQPRGLRAFSIPIILTRELAILQGLGQYVSSDSVPNAEEYGTPSLYRYCCPLRATPRGRIARKGRVRCTGRPRASATRASGPTTNSADSASTCGLRTGVSTSQGNNVLPATSSSRD